MTFQDIFKKSFLEGYAQTLTPASVAVCLLVAGLIGVYVFAAYRLLCRKAFYNKNFSISLIVIAVITAAIILTVQSNVVISLGMVGALSIVRFRTAIKDPMDLAFLFWSISVGIICGAGLTEVAVILSVVVTVGILVLDRLPVVRAPMLLVVNASDLDAEEAVTEVVRKYAGHFQVKSRSMAGNTLDMVLELRTSEGSHLVRELMKLEPVAAASLMTHDGEVTL